MTEKGKPDKVTRKRGQVAGSCRQRWKTIADAIGAHRATVQRWEYQGNFRYRMHRFLADQFELGKRTEGEK